MSRRADHPATAGARSRAAPAAGRRRWSP